jgi:hypothetical protein
MRLPHGDATLRAPPPQAVSRASAPQVARRLKADDAPPSRRNCVRSVGRWPWPQHQNELSIEIFLRGAPSPLTGGRAVASRA